MAAAAIPLIASIAPELISLIAALVHNKAPAAEADLGSGTGPVKFAQVFGEVIGALQSAAAAGTIAKTLPSDDTIKLVIQSVVSSMQLKNLLPAAPADPASPDRTTATGAVGQVGVVLRAGQTFVVSVQ